MFPKVTVAHGVKKIIRNFNYTKNTVEAGGCFKLIITLIDIKLNVFESLRNLLMRRNIVLMAYNYLSYLDYNKLEYCYLIQRPLLLTDPVSILILSLILKKSQY